MLRVFFKYNRKLLSSLCICARLALLKYLRAATGEELTPGIIAAIQSFGSKITFITTASGCPTGTPDGSFTPLDIWLIYQELSVFDKVAFMIASLKCRNYQTGQGKGGICL